MKIGLRIVSAFFLGCLLFSSIACKPTYLPRITADPFEAFRFAKLQSVQTGGTAHLSSDESAWSFENGLVTVFVPAGSIPATADLRIAKKEEVEGTAPNSRFEVQLTGEVSHPLGLSLQVDSSHLGGMAAENLALFQQFDDLWKMLPSNSSEIASPSYAIYSSIDGSGIYAAKNKETPLQGISKHGIRGIWVPRDGLYDIRLEISEGNVAYFSNKRPYPLGILTIDRWEGQTAFVIGAGSLYYDAEAKDLRFGGELLHFKQVAITTWGLLNIVTGVFSNCASWGIK